MSLRPVDGLPEALAPRAVNVDRVGMFRFDNVANATYNVSLVGLPPEAFVKSARYSGFDALDHGVVVAGREGSLDIRIGLSGGRVDGLVLDSVRKPLADARVVLVPELRYRDNFSMFRIQSTDQNGIFTIRGVPPGNYSVFAWDEVADGAYYDPEFLAQVEARGQPVAVNAGSVVSVQLSAIPK